MVDVKSDMMASKHFLKYYHRISAYALTLTQALYHNTCNMHVRRKYTQALYHNHIRIQQVCTQVKTNNRATMCPSEKALLDWYLKGPQRWGDFIHQTERASSPGTTFNLATKAQVSHVTPQMFEATRASVVGPWPWPGHARQLAHRIVLLAAALTNANIVKTFYTWSCPAGWAHALLVPNPWNCCQGALGANIACSDRSGRDGTHQAHSVPRIPTESQVDGPSVPIGAPAELSSRKPAELTGTAPQSLAASLRWLWEPSCLSLP
jgi:hypothetical protein